MNPALGKVLHFQIGDKTTITLAMLYCIALIGKKVVSSTLKNK